MHDFTRWHILNNWKAAITKACKQTKAACGFLRSRMILILEPGNAVSKDIFFRVKAPKRKYCNDVILAAIRQEPGIKVPKGRAPKYVVFQSILLSKEPRRNKRFLLFGFPGGNSFLFCSFLVGRSGLRKKRNKKYCKFKQCRACSRSTLPHSISKSKSIALHGTAAEQKAATTLLSDFDKILYR